MSARNLALSSALAAASFALCALLMEVVLRVAGFDPLGDLMTGRELILRESEHPELAYEFTPNARGAAWRTEVEINSHGMRDREYALAAGDALRVAALGDSVTFGSGVAPAERFTDRLALALGARLARPVEVLNLGVGGYDTLQEVISLEHRGLAFSPDLVLLAYCVNDVGDNSPNLEYIRKLRRLDSAFDRLRTVQLVRSWLDRIQLSSRLEAENTSRRFAERNRAYIVPVGDDARLTELRATLRSHRADDPGSFLLDWYLSDAHLGKLAYALGRLDAATRSRGIPVVVAILPWLEEHDAYPVTYAMVRYLAQARGFDVIDLHEPLARAGLAELKLRDDDPIHPNARGHQLIAESLEAFVAERLARAER